MKTLILTGTAALLALSMLTPVSAQPILKAGFNADAATSEMDRRRPRVPGGSGCDTPRDLIQHPECAG